MKTLTFAVATVIFDDDFIGWSRDNLATPVVTFHALQCVLLNTGDHALTDVIGTVTTADGTTRPLMFVSRGSFTSLSGLSLPVASGISPPQEGRDFVWLGSQIGDENIAEDVFRRDHTSFSVAFTIEGETQTVSFDATECEALADRALTWRP